MPHTCFKIITLRKPTNINTSWTMMSLQYVLNENWKGINQLFIALYIDFVCLFAWFFPHANRIFYSYDDVRFVVEGRQA